MSNFVAHTEVPTDTPTPETLRVAPDLHLQDPEKFDGSKSAFRGFITQCKLAFALQPQRFTTDQACVGFVLSLLKGPALDWAAKLWTRRPDMLGDLDAFTTEFHRQFDDPRRVEKAQSQLATIRQGQRSVADYTTEFQRLATELDWGDGPLKCQFYHGLRPEIKDELALVFGLETLDATIEVAIQIDDRLRSREQERAIEGISSLRSHGLRKDAAPARKPPGHLSAEERNYRYENELCYRCGDPDHKAAYCPLRKRSKGTTPPGKEQVQLKK